MTTVANPYDALYTNLKNRFTVIHDGKECTVGDFMLMKAGKSEKADKNSTALSVVNANTEHHALATIACYVNDKLTVKNRPVKDKTIRRFPIKTSASALLSSVAACALVMSCGIFALSGSKDASGLSLENTDTFEYAEVADGETETENLD